MAGLTTSATLSELYTKRITCRRYKIVKPKKPKKFIYKPKKK